MALITRYDRAEDNKGGFCQIRILKRSDFEINQVIYARYRGEGTINISANDTLENVFPICYHTPLLGDYEQPTNSSQFGTYYTQKFQFSVPKDRPNILQEITQLQDEPVAILLKNGNENWKAIGTEEDWAKFSVTQKTGGKPSDPNVYIVEISCLSRYPSPFLEFEKREVIIENPSDPCLNRIGGGGDINPFGRERRLPDFNAPEWQAEGTFIMIYNLPVLVTITIRSVESSTIYDQRTLQGNGQYTFTKNAERFVVIYGESAPTYERWNLTVVEECLPEV